MYSPRGEKKGFLLLIPLISLLPHGCSICKMRREERVLDNLKILLSLKTGRGDGLS